MPWQDHIPKDIAKLYEVHEFHHAATILANEFTGEFDDICYALRNFKFTEADVKARGGNESSIPRKFSDLLRPLGWVEGKLTAKIIIDDKEIRHDSHKVDYIKSRVAFDLEWNSKDQTFDRDLYAFRTFFEFDKISLGIIVTRSNQLDPWFATLGSYRSGGRVRLYKDKYASSTTHMGKLLPRLEAGRNGGCPVLVFGITTYLLE